MTYDPTIPPWKQTHHRQTDRQTDRGQGKELASQFSPFCTHVKRKSNTDHAASSPHPTHSSVGGAPLCKGRPQGSSMLFLHFGLLLATPCPLLHSASSSVAASPSSSPAQTLSLRSGLPAPGLLGKQHLGASFLPAQPGQALSAQDTGITLLPRSP